MCVVERYRVLAAVHLLRYADRPDVGEHYRNAGAIAWVLTRPESVEAAALALAAADERFAHWEVQQAYGWDTGLPLPIWGVPDVWPHVAAALETAGYYPDPNAHREALYGGTFDEVSSNLDPPSTDLELRRIVWPHGTRFAALHAGQEAGWCGIQTDLTRVGLRQH